FPEHPLGREVLGIPEVITSVTVPEIRSFFEQHYRPGNVVFAAAGDVDHDQLAEAVEARFAGRPAGNPPARQAPGGELVSLDVTERDSEQAHLVFGVRGPDRRAPERFALACLNHSLGGGLSSRLFQKIREERGLAYSIVSDRSAYADAGTLAVSVGTAPERAEEVLGLVVAELDELARHGVSDAELKLAKGHLRADMVLSLEESGSRMSRIGASQLLHGEVLSVEELLARIEAVTLEEVNGLAGSLLSSRRVLAVVGPFATADFAGAVS
ncbi:MAG TPA: pitrilysin family protein, partial [Acidimicrobiales bacterium]|nr:pitrilysin family protein [Acidimicrobiales bacterium]